MIDRLRLCVRTESWTADEAKLPARSLRPLAGKARERLPRAAVLRALSVGTSVVPCLLSWPRVPLGCFGGRSGEGERDGEGCLSLIGLISLERGGVGERGALISSVSFHLVEEAGV